MNRHDDLIKILQRIDGKGYKAYQEIGGTYQFQTFTLIIDHVQGDPFAEPSRRRILVTQSRAGFPLHDPGSPHAGTGCQGQRAYHPIDR
jgi:predicted ABC-class ATPase